MDGCSETSEQAPGDLILTVGSDSSRKNFPPELEISAY